MPRKPKTVPKARLVRSDDEHARLLSLGKRLLAARTAARMTQKALAEAADVTPRFIQQIESGQGNPSYLKVLAIVHALGRHGKSVLSSR